MHRELFGARECLAALSAYESIATMHAEVLVQVAALAERARAAWIWALERPYSRVDALVYCKAAHHAERLVASRKVTLERPLQCVRAHMLCQRARLAKALRAYGAHVRPVSRVCLDVAQQFLLLPKSAPFRCARAAAPPTHILGLARANVYVGDVLRELAVRLEAF